MYLCKILGKGGLLLTTPIFSPPDTTALLMYSIFKSCSCGYICFPRKRSLSRPNTHILNNNLELKNNCMLCVSKEMS